MFQQRHFVFVADLIRNAPYSTENEVAFQRQRWASHFADAFARDNPRFKRDKFLKACGVGQP